MYTWQTRAAEIEANDIIIATSGPSRQFILDFTYGLALFAKLSIPGQTKQRDQVKNNENELSC